MKRTLIFLSLIAAVIAGVFTPAFVADAQTLAAIPAAGAQPSAASKPPVPQPSAAGAQSAGAKPLAAAAKAPAPSRNTAFGDSEKLTLRVSYRAKLIPTTDLATATLTVKKLPSGDYSILGNGKTISVARWIYDIDDDYSAVVDPQTLRPKTASARLREGDYRYNYDMTFVWDSMRVHTLFGNLKRPLHRKTMTLTDSSFEIISLFYNMRNADISSFKSGATMYTDLVMEDTIQRIRFNYLGTETVDLKKLGQYRAHKFSCQLVALGDKSFFYLWISDDRNHIPLKLESPVKVGSVSVLLTDYSGLRNPFDSKIK